MRQISLFALFVFLILRCGAAAAGGTDPKPAEEEDASGSTMPKIIREAKQGFPSEFRDDEILAVMSASRGLKETNVTLARRLEGVAARMAGARAKKR